MVDINAVNTEMQILCLKAAMIDIKDAEAIVEMYERNPAFDGIGEMAKAFLEFRLKLEDISRIVEQQL